MRSGKHVVWLTPGFASSETDDYTTPTIQALAHYLSREFPEMRITILAVHFPYESGVYTWNNINVYAIGGKNKRYPFRFGVWREVMKTLRRIHQSDAIDLIHSFWYNETALLANRFCKSHRLPHICTLMGQDGQPSNRYLSVLKSSRIFKVAISDRAALDFETASGLKIDAIIPFGIDEVSTADIFDRTVDVLGVGSLNKIKRFDVFLSVIERVRTTIPDVRVEIIGDGPERETLERMTIEKDLSNNVKFAGLLKRGEVLDHMRRSKVFLHTAAAEGMGFVFLEAAASGCAVAATPAGIVVNDEFTLVSELADELAAHTCKWLQDNQIFTPRITYAVKQTAEEYVSLYNKLKAE